MNHLPAAAGTTEAPLRWEFSAAQVCPCAMGLADSCWVGNLYNILY